jgi:tRNA threonylcarbamoyladenosine modification (KEOPS) complex  Pcc1 subunit
MSAAGGPWTATISVRTRSSSLATRLERALRPEAEREVPRARAVLRRTSGELLELQVAARDTGAMRAALNTYLGWVQLSLETVRSVAGSGADGTNAA